MENLHKQNYCCKKCGCDIEMIGTILIDACRTGKTDIVDFLHQVSPGPKSYLDYAYFMSLTEGQFVTATKLKILWPIINDSKVRTRVFQLACRSGNLILAKELKEQWPDINHRDNNDRAFYLACEFGNLEIAQWLKNKWPDIGVDHYSKNDEIFVKVCRNGHLELAQWLKSELPEINHRSDDDLPFFVACFAGHLELVQWLKKTWPDINHQIFNRYVIAGIGFNHQEIAQYLKSLDFGPVN
jgi:hypothetical protein